MPLPMTSNIQHACWGPRLTLQQGTEGRARFRCRCFLNDLGCRQPEGGNAEARPPELEPQLHHM